LFKIYLITDRKLAAAHGGLIAMTEAALSAAPPNSVALQLREKDLGARELLELARQLRIVCDRYGARLLVNDRLDVAIAAGADGVHLPSNSFALADARALLGPDRLIGVSTHDHGEVVTASTGGANFVVYGPVFDPLSKSASTMARGADGLRAAISVSSIPVFALGGINPARVRELRAKISIANAEDGGASRPLGVAVIGAVFGATNAAAAMHELIDSLAS
jgi:thiamine-phosphate pyrophosphorylase